MVDVQIEKREVAPPPPSPFLPRVFAVVIVIAIIAVGFFIVAPTLVGKDGPPGWADKLDGKVFSATYTDEAGYEHKIWLVFNYWADAINVGKEGPTFDINVLAASADIPRPDLSATIKVDDANAEPLFLRDYTATKAMVADRWKFVVVFPNVEAPTTVIFENLNYGLEFKNVNRFYQWDLIDNPNPPSK